MRITNENEKALDICRRAIKALQLKLKCSHIPEDISSVSEAVEHIAESVYEIPEIETMIQAIEKQIPKKPIGFNQLRKYRGQQVLLDDFDSFRCPTCGNDELLSGIDRRGRYCWSCGQRLNWDGTSGCKNG